MTHIISLLIILVCLSFPIEAEVQAEMVIQFFAPGGEMPTREVNFTIACDSITSVASTDRKGVYKMALVQARPQACWVNVQPDKGNRYWASVHIYYRPGLERSPVFLNAANSSMSVSRSKYASTKEYDDKAPVEARTAYESALNAYRLGKIESAINDFTEALTLHPQYLSALNQLGMLYFNNKRYEEAMGAFGQAVSIDPRVDSARFNLGAIQYQQGKNGDALLTLTELLRYHPNFSMARPMLAEVLIRSQQWDEAEQQLRLAIADQSLDVNSRAEAHYLLARVLAHGERYKSAVSEADKALALKPDWPNAPMAYLIKGGSLAELKQDEEAEKALLKAYEIGAKRAASANLLLGQLYLNQKRYEAAQKVVERYMNDVPGAANMPQVREILERIRSGKTANQYREQ